MRTVQLGVCYQTEWNGGNWVYIFVDTDYSDRQLEDDCELEELAAPHLKEQFRPHIMHVWVADIEDGVVDET